MDYIVPEYNKKAFSCPHCSAFAEQKWAYNYIVRDDIETHYVFDINLSKIALKVDFNSSNNFHKEIAVSTCNYCHEGSLWFDKKMIIPKTSNIPMPIKEMPENVKEIYNEARDVFAVSPKAAAALLRLGLQHLCVELGGKGKNINDDIGELVKKGLPVEIQQALDVVRVAGNNAVHPGTLDLEDDSTSTAYLFNIINMIVDNRIVQPKKINEFYNSLPSNALKGIEKRDR